jgi:hypothetical protein
MREAEMEQIAGLIAECIQKGKEVRVEANRLRQEYKTVQYSFDELLGDLASPNLMSVTADATGIKNG